MNRRAVRALAFVGGGAFAAALAAQQGALAAPPYSQAGSSTNSSDAGVGTGTGTGGTTTQTQCLTPQLRVCSDAQIVAILRAENQSEVDIGNAVAKRVSNSQVRSFAQRMISDHTKAISQLEQLIKSTGIQPEENDLSQEIDESTDMEISSLAKKSGSELDSSYIAYEVLDHIQDIGVADHLLKPSAKNAHLVNLLSTLRPVLLAHEELANQVQTAISGKCGGNLGTGADAGADAGP